MQIRYLLPVNVTISKLSVIYCMHTQLNYGYINHTWCAKSRDLCANSVNIMQFIILDL